MTNAERIRSMNDEELADLLAEITYSGKGPWEEPFEQLFCETCPAPEYTLDDGRKLNLHECNFEGCECPPRQGYRVVAGAAGRRRKRKIKILIGGSPCTHWSIAQTKHRETKAEGIGWELFLNYKIALDKYQPDFFLYENNRSMSAAIRAQITAELCVEPVMINSALVSAQNRQRLYWVGRRNPDGTYSQVRVEQPEDRGVLLRDILESGICWREKGYKLKAQYYKNGIANFVTNGGYSASAVAEPVRIGTIENDAKNQDHDSQQYRVYSHDAKSATLCGNGGGLGAKTGLYAVPVKEEKVGIYPNGNGELTQCQSKRIYSVDAKGRVLNAGPGGLGVQTGLYAVPMRVRETTKQGYVDIAPGECVDLAMPGSKTRRGRAMREKSNCLTTSCEMYEYCGTLDMPIYQVRDGRITIKGEEYPIKLRDDCYIIRKLTVTECKRLQTVPDTYAFPVSDTQAYKMLGNGWTVDVISHIMSHFDGLTEEPVEVLSMYDGMSCGHIALDKLGVDVVAYYATEIDKYAIQTTKHNYPDTVHLGDAFQVRGADWGV